MTFVKELLTVKKGMSEKEVETLYAVIDKDVMADYFFYSSMCRDCDDLLSLTWRSATYYFSYDNKPAVVVWISEIRPGTGVTNYYIFQEWRGNLSADIFKECVEWLLKHDWWLLIGLSPSENIAGLKFLKKIGVNIVGKMEGVKWFAKQERFTDYIVSYKCRGEYK